MSELRILVVDDEQNVRNAIGRWFKAKGFDVDMAEDGDVAVQKCAQNEYDVVTMDLEMPRMNGTKATKAIKDMRPSVPVIVLTGYCERAQEVLDCGAFKILSKPMGLAELEREVREALVRSAQ